jgi:hypothetical protein
VEKKELFLQSRARVPETRLDYPNTCGDEMEVAVTILNDEVEGRRQDSDATFAHLRKSIEFDDDLNFSELWLDAAGKTYICSIVTGTRSY